MAKANQKRKLAGSDNANVISSEEKIARALGLLLVKDVRSSNDQASQLRRVGFEIAEIAELLDMSANNVSVAVHRAKKAVKTKGKAAAE